MHMAIRWRGRLTFPNLTDMIRRGEDKDQEGDKLGDNYSTKWQW